MLLVVHCAGHMLLVVHCALSSVPICFFVAVQVSLQCFPRLCIFDGLHGYFGNPFCSQIHNMVGLVVVLSENVRPTVTNFCASTPLPFSSMNALSSGFRQSYLCTSSHVTVSVYPSFGDSAVPAHLHGGSFASCPHGSV